MPATLHLLKLCVGADGVEDLIAWQADRIGRAPRRRPRSRALPRHPHVAEAGRRRSSPAARSTGCSRAACSPASASSASSRAAATTASSAAPSGSTRRSSAPCRSRAARSRAGATSAPRTRPAISLRHRAPRRAARARRRARRRSECSDMRRPPASAPPRSRSSSRCPPPAPPRSKYDWDALGAEFCRADARRRPRRPPPAAHRRRSPGRSRRRRPNPELLPPQRAVPELHQRGARSARRTPATPRWSRSTAASPAARAPSWTEYLVIVPEADGTSRIDDVLFATRRSDTLRGRLGYFAGWR